MKRIFLIAIFSLTLQFSFGQSCGIYSIKYVGKVKSELLTIEKIKLPTIEFLHEFAEENSENGFIEIEPIDNDINVEVRSFLLSELYEKPESLLELYKSKRNKIPIIIIVIEEGKPKEIRMELTWNNIQISKLENEKFGNLFELNLNEIILQ